MKKSLLLLFVGCGLAFTSCSEAAPEENNESTANNTAEVEKDNQINQFNNEIVSNIDESEIHLAKLKELDAMDIPAEEMISSAEAIVSDLDTKIAALQNLQPAGNGGEEFVSAAIGHLINVKAVATVYIDFAADLAIPDSLWTEEIGAMWMNLAEPQFGNYEDSYEQLEMSQANFGSLNDKDLVPSGETLEEMAE